MQKTINGATLRKMLITSYSLLEENKNNVDALNVFPVPDGDTGTNMTLTLKSAVTEMNACEGNSVEALCVAFNRGALKGARGNSGVILSQIIKGMFSELMKCTEITNKDFARACEKGCETAYKAVTVPKEGTILTIIKAIAESAKQNVKADNFQDYLHSIIADAEKALQMTPDMLPVLKKAGVVDAGGRGLVIIFSGMYKMLAGEMVNVEFVDKVEKDVTSEENHVNYESLADIRYGYCTEFFIINIFEKTTEADINSLRQHLLEIGDCVLCIGDLQLVKVHVHTNEPNKALGYALQLGELNGVKIENMLEQNRQLRKNA
ncbi:MAG: DAK2 domain-containing protein, partial [Clostridia bacterium]|nr:DAK2 domain-containing protein [Clostridia bacterium]